MQKNGGKVQGLVWLKRCQQRLHCAAGDQLEMLCITIRDAVDLGADAEGALFWLGRVLQQTPCIPLAPPSHQEGQPQGDNSDKEHVEL